MTNKEDKRAQESIQALKTDMTAAIGGVQATPSIPITPAQITTLQNLLTEINTTATAYVNAGSNADITNLRAALEDLNTFLTPFPYQSTTALSRFLIAVTRNLLQMQLTGGITPGIIGLTLQQLYTGLGNFIDSLEIDLPSYNLLLNTLVAMIGNTAFQPATFKVPISATNTSTLQTITNSLLSATTSFFNNPTTTNNQNLQNTIQECLDFFQTFKYRNYGIYAEEVAGEVKLALQAVPVSVGRVAQILLQFYAAYDSFLEHLQMNPVPYQQILSNVATAVSRTAAVQTAGPTGPQGPAGIQGPAGPQGIQGPMGPEGSEGPQGIQGLRGPTGPTGPAGSGGGSGTLGVYGQIYSINQNTVGPGQNFPFNLTSEITNPQLVPQNGDSVVVNVPGVYYLAVYLTPTNSGNFTAYEIKRNGVVIPGGTIFSNANPPVGMIGTQPVTGVFLVRLNQGDILSVMNLGPDTITLLNNLPATDQELSTSMVLFKIAD